MQKIKTYKLPIIVLVIAAIAAGAGLYIAGIIGPGGKDKVAAKKHTEPISFTEPFIINLNDQDDTRNHYIKLRMAVRLEPMTEADYLEFESTGDGGGHGGGGETVTGKMRVSHDPALRDAVNVTVSQFTSAELKTKEGKQELKDALLVAFAKVAQNAAPHPLADGKGADAAYPPYHVEEVLFEDFAVQ